MECPKCGEKMTNAGDYWFCIVCDIDIEKSIDIN